MQYRGAEAAPRLAQVAIILECVKFGSNNQKSIRRHLNIHLAANSRFKLIQWKDDIASFFSVSDNRPLAKLRTGGEMVAMKNE